MEIGETLNVRTPGAAPHLLAAERCRIEMLGPLRVVRENEVIARFSRQKAVALLAYLGLRPGLHPRERIIDMLWPDLDLAAGRDNLSTTLGSLRRQLEPVGVRKGAVLVANHASVGLNGEVVSTDVADFERLINRAANAPDDQTRMALLTQAVELYRGDLLPGVYQDWAILEVERLQGRYLTALGRLAETRETLGQTAEALEITRLHVSAEPYLEDAHCRLIRLSVALGRIDAARGAAAQFERLFEEEFGSPPSAKSRGLVEAYLAASPTVAQGQVESAHRAAVAHATPSTSLVPFFGREVQVDLLARSLLGPPGSDEASRLITLVGAGGIGKTRLSIEFARIAAERHGVAGDFVSLADVTIPNQIAAQIAAALGTNHAEREPLDRVLDYFRLDAQGMRLLILDNLEQLLADPGGEAEVVKVIRTLLDKAPHIALLCTSRRRIGLREERLLPLQPLAVPDDSGDLMDEHEVARIAGIASVRLYVDRARAIRPDFGLTSTNARAVASLCRQLEGNPLAIELAAAWVRTLPPRKMWERLSAGLEIPPGSYTDFPERHRSLSAALDWSFRLLDQPLQLLFARLCSFRGVGWLTPPRPFAKRRTLLRS